MLELQRECWLGRHEWGYAWLPHISSSWSFRDISIGRCSPDSRHELQNSVWSQLWLPVVKSFLQSLSRCPWYWSVAGQFVFSDWISWSWFCWCSVSDDLHCFNWYCRQQRLVALMIFVCWLSCRLSYHQRIWWRLLIYRICENAGPRCTGYGAELRGPKVRSPY